MSNENDEKPIVLNDIIKNEEDKNKPVYLSVYACGGTIHIPLLKEDIDIQDSKIIINASYN